MAYSSNFKTANGDIRYRIITTEVAHSDTDNTTTLNVKVQAWSTNSRTSVDYDGECFVKVDGIQATTSSWSQGQKPIGLNSYTQLYDGNFTITHNQYGNRDVDISAYFVLYDDYGNFIVSSSYKSFSVSLTRLHHTQTSLDSVGDLLLDETGLNYFTLYVTLYNDSLDVLHTLNIKMNGSSIMTYTNRRLANNSNTIALSSSQRGTLASYLKNRNRSSAELEFELTTYYNGTSIGVSTNYGVVKLKTSNTDPLFSLRPGEINVNGDISCRYLNLSGDIFTVEDHCLFVHTPLPGYRVEGTKLIEAISCFYPVI